MFNNTNINNFKFIKSENIIDIMTDYCYLIFIGRSNVGKSSFINTITNNKYLANTSKKPGSTKLFNIYENKQTKFIIIDTPGYGYSKNSQKTKEQSSKNIIRLFNDFSNLHSKVLFVQFIDSRIFFTKNDLVVNDMIKDYGYNYYFVFTKYDKLNQSGKYKLQKNVANNNILDYLFSYIKLKKDIIIKTLNLWIQKMN